MGMINAQMDVMSFAICFKRPGGVGILYDYLHALDIYIVPQTLHKV